MKPTARITSINREFFGGCNRSELRVQRCGAPECGKHVFYPRVACPHCGRATLSWETVSGRGRIVSFTKVQRPQHEAFFAEAPYYFIAVRLDEGPLLFSRLQARGEVNEHGLIGKSVRAVFVEHTPEQKLPFFQI
jgi:uncharacterized OB-fold protein